ncbi:MAG: aldo/keto reductase [Chloroflexota bacterium]
MEYVQFGAAGVRVSRIALGLAFRGQFDEAEMERIIERAVEDHGVNFMDCANTYGRAAGPEHRGRSERVLGRVLKRRRDDLYVSTKVNEKMGEGTNDRGNSRYHIMREVERSLRRLETDHLDQYLIHHYDPTTPLEETLRAMDDLVSQGKTRYVGVANFSGWQLVDALWTQERIGADPLICAQNEYSLLHRAPEKELLPAAREHGTGVMVYSPLAVGLLTGAYTPGEPPPEGSIFARYTPLQQRYPHIHDGRLAAALTALSDVAQAHGKTMAQAAINWTLAHPAVGVAIIGPDTVEQLDENCGAVDWSITEREKPRLDDATTFD